MGAAGRGHNYIGYGYIDHNYQCHNHVGHNLDGVGLGQKVNMGSADRGGVGDANYLELWEWAKPGAVVEQ